jgi:metal-dependent amidase/aminoacylase/carboxypeptidase family protein
MGNVAYGISPGRAEVGATIRSSDDGELRKITERMYNRVDFEAKSFDGEIAIRKIEPFSSTINDSSGTEMVKKVADRSGLRVQEMDEPFAWSEDFGELRQKCPITLFGLGTGKEHPPLHSEIYDFNDRLIETGVQLFAGLISS